MCVAKCAAKWRCARESEKKSVASVMVAAMKWVKINENDNQYRHRRRSEAWRHRAEMLRIQKMTAVK